MKTELEIRRELKLVRSLLAKNRRDGIDTDMLYGAQQALGWVIDQLSSPSDLETNIQAIAKELTLRGSRGEGIDER